MQRSSILRQPAFSVIRNRAQTGSKAGGSDRWPLGESPGFSGLFCLSLPPGVPTMIKQKVFPTYGVFPQVAGWLILGCLFFLSHCTAPPVQETVKISGFLRSSLRTQLDSEKRS